MVVPPEFIVPFITVIVELQDQVIKLPFKGSTLYFIPEELIIPEVVWLKEPWNQVFIVKVPKQEV